MLNGAVAGSRADQPAWKWRAIEGVSKIGGGGCRTKLEEWDRKWFRNGQTPQGRTKNQRSQSLGATKQNEFICMVQQPPT